MARTNVIDATAKLQEAIDGGDKTAVDMLREIQGYNSNRMMAKDELKLVRKECKNAIEQEEAALKNAIEDSLPAAPTKDDYRSKLVMIESHHQECEETRALGVERKKEAKDRLEMWEKRFEKSIQESRQLTLDID